jgi:Tol biopolymer transport system component
MRFSSHVERPTLVKPPPPDRLNSWKEIAEYLDTSVRTVQRWERAEGLPVRRHEHAGGGGTAYALTREVDAWRESRRKRRVLSPRSRLILWRAVFGSMAVLLAATSAWLVWKRSPGRTGELRSVQLTTSAGLDIGASFSPDGNSFVYSSNRSGRFELYKGALSSAAVELQITSDGTQNIEPAWSADGKWIAYHSVAQHGIWLIPSTGGTARRLTGFGSMPAWSPDSRQIAFSGAEAALIAWFGFGAAGAQDPRIWTVAADGSQLRQVTFPNRPSGGHTMPAWSPDGKRLAFVAVTNDASIWNLELSSGKLDMLVQVGRDLPRPYATRWNLLRDPRFSPTGNGLYFAAMNEKGSYAIYWQRRSGEQPKELYSTNGDAPMAIGLLPDGKRLVFTRFLNTSQLWSLKPGAEPKPLFQGAVLRAYRPSFSPDGRLLAFGVETVGRSADMWIMNAEGTGVMPISSESGPKESGDTWTLDGTGLLYTYFDGPRIEFRRYDTVQKTNRVLYSWPSLQGLTRPVLMPDEQVVLASCSRPLNLCLAPGRGGPPRQITFEREGASYPNISRDGEWINYGLRGYPEQIGIMDRNGGHQERLTDDSAVYFPGSFASDNRRISYASYRDGVWNLWWIDRVTRERRQLTHLTTYGPYVRYPAWRPGSEEIVYEYSQVKGNIYLLSLR